MVAIRMGWCYLLVTFIKTCLYLSFSVYQWVRQHVDFIVVTWMFKDHKDNKNNSDNFVCASSSKNLKYNFVILVCWLCNSFFFFFYKFLCLMCKNHVTLIWLSQVVREHQYIDLLSMQNRDFNMNLYDLYSWNGNKLREKDSLYIVFCIIRNSVASLVISVAGPIYIYFSEI